MRLPRTRSAAFALRATSGSRFWLGSTLSLSVLGFSPVLHWFLVSLLWLDKIAKLLDWQAMIALILSQFRMLMLLMFKSMFKEQDLWLMSQFWWLSSLWWQLSCLFAATQPHQEKLTLLNSFSKESSESSCMLPLFHKKQQVLFSTSTLVMKCGSWLRSPKEVMTIIAPCEIVGLK